MGETHGTRRKSNPALKGPHPGTRLYQITFINLYPMSYQQLPQFLTKRYIAVMFLLVFDVFDQRVLVVVGNGERAVTILPMPERREHCALLDPFIRADFDFFDQVRNANPRMDSGQDMHVILNSVDAIEMTFFI